MFTQVKFSARISQDLICFEKKGWSHNRLSWQEVRSGWEFIINCIQTRNINSIHPRGCHDLLACSLTVCAFWCKDSHKRLSDSLGGCGYLLQSLRCDDLGGQCGECAPLNPPFGSNHPAQCSRHETTLRDPLGARCYQLVDAGIVVINLQNRRDTRCAEPGTYHCWGLWNKWRE